MLIGAPNKTTYVETRMDYSAIREYGYTGNNINATEITAFLSVFIQMDALYKVYERDAFTFIMAISMTGGIMSIITLVFSVIM